MTLAYSGAAVGAGLAILTFLVTTAILLSILLARLLDGLGAEGPPGGRVIVNVLLALAGTLLVRACVALNPSLFTDPKTCGVAGGIIAVGIPAGAVLSLVRAIKVSRSGGSDRT